MAGDGTQLVPDVDPATGKRFGLTHLGWHGPGQTPPPENPEGPEDGDPVNLSSGAFILKQTDLSINGSRGNLIIERHYRTLSAATGPFGIGTKHNYSYALDTNNPQGSMVVNLIMPDGNFVPFTKQPDGTFINPTIPMVRGAVMSEKKRGQVCY